MQSEKQYSYIGAFRWIYSRLQKHRKKQFWILFAGMSFSAFMETVALGSVAFFASTVTDPEVVLSSRYIRFARDLVDVELLNSIKGVVLISGLSMVSLIALKNVLKGFVTYWITRFGVGIEAYFGKILMNGLLNLPYQWHLTCNSADLVNAVGWRVYLGRNFFEPCLKIFNNVLMVGIMLSALFVVQPLVSFIVIVVLGGAAAFIYTVIRKQVDRSATAARDYQIAINKEVTMAIHGIKDVKINLKAPRFVSKFSKKVLPLSGILGVQRFYSESPVLILETLGFGMLCLSIFVMMLWFNISTAYVTGTMAILAVTAWKALPTVNQILGNITSVRNSLPYLANQIYYFHLIENDNKISATHVEQANVSWADQAALLQQAEVETASDDDRLTFDKKIQFENVCYSYQEGGIEVIRDLGFEITKGRTIGIIGASGAGKSTLVDLLIGLLFPKKGVIAVDEVPLTRKMIPQWLKLVGYVPQTPYIYDGTLAENIAFGMEGDEIDRARVSRCCTMASMDDFIHDLPHGIDSFIGERGVRLSGGQQQRVAIARALYTNPEVLIFDEATSSLDTKSEKSIQETIYSFKGKVTLIIIAHRLSTVEECDSILWMEKGELKMHGAADKVLGLYRESAQQQ